MEENDTDFSFTSSNKTEHADYAVFFFVLTHARSFRIGGLCVAILGFIGNTLAIIVLQRKRMWCSTAYFLILLAIYDNIILIVAIWQSVSDLQSNSDTSIVIHKITYVLFIPVSYIAQTGTIFMTLMVTIERYVAVTKPLKARIIFSLSSAKKISLGIFLWCLIYNIPHYVALDLSYTTATSKVHLSEFGKQYIYTKVYSIYIQLLAMYVLPWLAMTVFNILLLRCVKKITMIRHNCHSKSAADDGRRLTLPVIAVTTVFFLAYPFPAFEDTFCKLFDPSKVGLDGTCGAKMKILFELISDIAKVLNSAANFIFYCLLGRKFRRTFLHLASSWRRRMSTVVVKSSMAFDNQGTLSKAAASVYLDRELSLRHDIDDV